MRILIIPLIVAALGVSGTARADAMLDQFFGTYRGAGFTEESAASEKRNTKREFEMRISPYKEEGFTLVTWTMGNKEADDSNGGKLWTSKASFQLSQHEGVYHAMGSTDPLSGRLLSWVRIADDSLIVYRVAIDNAGVPEFQIFRRSLTTEGLELSFTAQRDGKRVRRVHGRYVRQ